MALIEYSSLVLSAGAVLAASTVYILHRKKLENLEEQVESNTERVDEIMEFEERVFENEGESEEFEKDLSDLSERLFHMLKEKYDLEVTTYEEAIEKIDEMDVEDEERKQALEELFEYITELEYSDEEPSEEQKALIRQAAFKLIRTTAPALRNRETGK